MPISGACIKTTLPVTPKVSHHMVSLVTSVCDTIVVPHVQAPEVLRCPTTSEPEENKDRPDLGYSTAAGELRVWRENRAGGRRPGEQA